MLFRLVVAIAVFIPSLPAVQHTYSSRMTQKAIDNLPLALQVDRQRRMLEPLIFTLIFITFSMLLPLLFSCQTPDCVNQQVLNAALHCLYSICLHRCVQKCTGGDMGPSLPMLLDNSCIHIHASVIAGHH
jgi:hypothetical protein